jgi:SAM-dependent methyltransferase
MRPSIRAFVQTVTGLVTTPDPIVEFGAFRAPGLEQLADLRPLFPGRTYLGTDVRDGPGVDRVLDLHAIDLADGSVGTALVLDTLEHVREPQRAMRELHRVLGQDGVLVVSTVMDYPIHQAPEDYWRFTPQGLAALLEPFAAAVVQHTGDPGLPRTVAGVAFRSTPEPGTVAALEVGLRAWAESVEPRWKRSVRLVTPPVVLRGARRLLGVRGL